jgi:hypothetical protein
MELKMLDMKPDCGCSGTQTGCCGGGNEAILVDTAGVTKVPWWVTGTIQTAAGVVPQVATRLDKRDRYGSWKARWGIGRMDYRIPPGLYGTGNPDSNSPVFVTANYKMTFDRLRMELAGVDGWIMVLDTKGINVWCAAGKGTFGTEEIINRIAATRLGSVVTHRTLILPQLGAPGVAAHEVKKGTSFTVSYGPVRAADIPAFLKGGNKATAAMRQVHFGMMDRLVLTPLELVGAVKPASILLGLLFVFALVQNLWAPFLTLVAATVVTFLPFLGAIVAGAVLTPVLLPYIPGRAFAWKGWLLGFVLTLLFLFVFGGSTDWETSLFYLLALPVISSYLAMNFTGASTYTSLSGVVKEMKKAVPLQIISAAAGIVVLVVGLFTKS